MTRPPPTPTLFPSTPLSLSDAGEHTARHDGGQGPRASSRRDAIGGSEAKRQDHGSVGAAEERAEAEQPDRKSTRLNSSHANISYAVFCLKKKNTMVRQQLFC